MKKIMLVGLSVLALGLSACEPSVSSSSTTDPSSTTTSESPSTTTSQQVVVDEDTVLELLLELSTSPINGYQYTLRQYGDSYIDGTIYTNNLEVMNLQLHEDSFEGTASIYSGMQLPTDLTSDSVIEGRYAQYILDEETYIIGFEATGDDDSQNYYSYNENHMYIDLYSTGLGNFAGLLDDVMTSFVTPDEMWPSGFNFTVGEVEISQDADNNFVCTIGASAPEDEWYSAEESSATVVISSDGSQIVGLSFEMVVFDKGESSDIDANANSYTYSEVKNISVGEPLTDEVTPFDITHFSDDQILNAPSQVVSGIADGELSEDTVKEILDNYDAYIDGVVSSTTQSYILEYYDFNTGLDLGAANVTETKHAYADNILIAETTFDFVNEESGTLTNYSQTVAGENGIEIMSGAEGNYTGTLLGPSNIRSFDSYFSASPLTNDLTISEAFSYIAENGFVATTGSYTNNDASLVSATKNGSTIEISLTYSTEFPGIYSSSYEMEIVIVDDFMTTLNSDAADGSYNHYSLVKGELTPFTGELIPFEETSYGW